MLTRDIQGVRVPCFAVFVVVILFIVIYWVGKTKLGFPEVLQDFRLFQKSTFVDFPVTGWSVTHFILYCVLGVLFPGHHFLFFVIGAGWESYEELMKTPWLPFRAWVEGEAKPGEYSYWTGSLGDLCMNMAGYTIGDALAGRFWPNNQNQPRREGGQAGRTGGPRAGRLPWV